MRKYIMSHKLKNITKKLLYIPLLTQHRYICLKFFSKDMFYNMNQLKYLIIHISKLFWTIYNTELKFQNNIPKCVNVSIDLKWKLKMKWSHWFTRMDWSTQNIAKQSKDHLNRCPRLNIMISTDRVRPQCTL